jgi:hypothetical protein
MLSKMVKNIALPTDSTIGASHVSLEHSPTYGGHAAATANLVMQQAPGFQSNASIYRLKPTTQPSNLRKVATSNAFQNIQAQRRENSAVQRANKVFFTAKFYLQRLGKETKAPEKVCFRVCYLIIPSVLILSSSERFL